MTNLPYSVFFLREVQRTKRFCVSVFLSEAAQGPFANPDLASSLNLSDYHVFFPLLRYLPDDRGNQNAGAVGERRYGGLGQHDPRQDSSAETEEHGAEPAGQGADSGHLQSSCTQKYIYIYLLV